MTDRTEAMDNLIAQDADLIEICPDDLVLRLRYLAEEWFEMCDDIHKPLYEAAERIEALTAENERLRAALRPFAIASEKGRAVYIGVAMAMKEKPNLFSYKTAYIDAGRTTASSHITWNDYDDARITFFAEPEVGQPWLRTYDAHLKGKTNGD